MQYLLHLLILITFYVILSQSLNLIGGYAGMISLAHAGFYGIGAYVTAILSVNYGVSILLTLPASIIICGITALLISSIALRTVEDYFIICTLGIQVIIFSLMNNLMDLTNGPMGIPGIPPIRIFGFLLKDKLMFFIICLIICTLIFLFISKIIKSPFGKILQALSEDEIFTQSIGKNVYRAKIITFTLGAMIASIPGVLYAHYISYVDPTSFTVDESIFILSITIIGGTKNLRGVIYSSAFLILLPEILRFFGLPDFVAANLRQIIYGIILILYIFNLSNRAQKFLK